MRSHNASAGMGSPVPAEAVVEIDRIATRWLVLPLESAESGMPSARRVLDDLTARVGRGPVPDLGPGALIDQLRVLVWDAYRAGRGDGIPDLLAGLRRDLP
ncbi:MAG: hypothetical protein IPL94_11285 [Tetrasphaera sp.]|nr:hypothetical protein [Tetrasphaera sp.]